MERPQRRERRSVLLENILVQVTREDTLHLWKIRRIQRLHRPASG
jgi:hypothetical protein